MIKPASILSILFFLSFLVYINLGVFILRSNIKANLNRLFFASCLALSFWSFSFVYAIDATKYEVALFWRQAAVLGYGIFYSLLLNYVLELTGYYNQFLKKWWIYLLLYIPSALNFYVFGLSNNYSSYVYILHKSSMGWTNIPDNNSWDYYFYIYYFSFSLLSIILIFIWGRDSEDLFIKKQASLILKLIIGTMIAGTLNDVVFSSFFRIETTQLAPIIILAPILIFFILIKQYGFMIPETSLGPTEILSNTNRFKLFNYINIILMLGALLNFSYKHLIKNAATWESMQLSIIMLMAGIASQFIFSLVINDKVRDNLLLLAVSIAIILTYFDYIDEASITVWAMVFPFIVLFLLFDRKMLIGVSVSALSSEIIVWILKPAALVPVLAMDHFVRMIILIITIGVALYANNIYLKRLIENSRQLLNQKFISYVSANLISAVISDIDQKIDSVIAGCGNHFAVDHILIYLWDGDFLVKQYKWIRKQVGHSPFYSDDQETLSCYRNQLAGRQSIIYLPEQCDEQLTEIQKNSIRSQNIKTRLAHEIIVNHAVSGVIFLDSIKVEKSWSDEELTTLQISVNMLSDTLGKIESEKKINFLAYYDQLTSLPNRTLFKDRAQQAIELAKRTNKKIGVMFLDIDSFKLINDKLGHDGGDKLLRLVAGKLSHRVRKQDTVARFGGDEFLLLFNNINDTNELHIIANDIMNIFYTSFNIKGSECSVKSSAGISIYPNDGIEIDILIENADFAMYQAKSAGKNQYKFCTEYLRYHAQNVTKLKKDLKGILEREELLIYFQPQLDLRTKKIIGLEALLRWKHPDLGLIKPNQFIPLAEEAGLMPDIGEWTFTRICEIGKKWTALGILDGRMTLNVSWMQLSDPHFIKTIKGIVNNIGLDPNILEFEIDEITIMKDEIEIQKSLIEINNLGIRISIDDFGIKYLSFHRIKNIPANKIIIAKQFIDGIGFNYKDEAIIKVIIDLTHNLGWEIIAEGVETIEQLTFLEKAGCFWIQGNYYYSPLQEEDIELILKQSN